MRDLLGKPFIANINGQEFRSGEQGFFATGAKQVLKLRTREGFELRLTPDHLVRRVATETRYRQEYEWGQAADLQVGDRIALHNHRTLHGWEGKYTEAQGYLLGLLVGDGTLKSDAAVLSVWDKGWPHVQTASRSPGRTASLPPPRQR